MLKQVQHDNEYYGHPELETQWLPSLVKEGNEFALEKKGEFEI